MKTNLTIILCAILMTIVFFGVGKGQAFADSYSNEHVEEKIYCSATIEEDFEDMVEDDERLYRVIVYLTIFDDIVKTFAEFNQAMRETNGQPSPQSNFIVNDLRRYIGFIKFSAQHNKIQDPELLKLIDDVEKVFSYMEGKEKLPEGKDFGKVFDETKIYIKSLLAAYETKWRNSFTKVFQDVIEFEKARAPKA